ncbi:MAG: CAP domain-containing protein [Proteobacteria bacterium]|nr:MAG: CAP domain-containing protein [Pseudomonadota bacterium]
MFPKSSSRFLFLSAAAIPLCSLVLASCAQVVIEQDAKGNPVSVDVEPLFGGKNSFLPTTKVQSKSIEQMEEAIRQGINRERQKKGLQPLKSNDKLRKIARDYSRQMNAGKFFSHYDKAGKSVADRVKGAGIKYQWVGENLYKSVNSPDVVAMAVRGWMNSKGHRENILRPQFTETGVGLWKDGNTYHATQVLLLLVHLHQCINFLIQQQFFQLYQLR